GAGQAFDQGNTKYTLTGGGAWKRVEVPLTVTLTEATKIRVQVYEQTKNTNIDIDGAQLLNSGLENASFALGATPPPGCGTTYDWTAYPNGGSLAKCDYASESGAEQGGSFLEINDTAEGGSVGQDVPFTPRVGQTYTFSVWLRAPAAAVNGTVAIYSINGAGQAFDQGNTKYTLTGGGAWKRGEVPLTVDLTEATKIRVQVYEQTKNTNIDIDGAQLLNSGLENASFALGATPPPGCGTTYDWTAYPN